MPELCRLLQQLGMLLLQAFHLIGTASLFGSLGQLPGESQSKPISINMVYPEPCKDLRRRDIRKSFYGKGIVPY